MAEAASIPGRGSSLPCLAKARMLARAAPIRGRKMAARYMYSLPLHNVDVFDGNRTAVAEIDH